MDIYRNCPVCHGRKKAPGIGGMDVTCTHCDALGIVKVELENHPISNDESKKKSKKIK